MKNLIRLLILLLAFSLQDIYGQSSLNYLNYKKYWWYRYRLINDFLVIGDCQGCSLPMAQRAAPDLGNSSIINVARWGDNTINLGHYIAVLATEYELLKRASQPTDATVRELYYALQAVNRLDRNAEAGISCQGCYPLVSSSGNLNGFFMKDDVYSNFLTDHQELKEGLVTGKPVEDVRSDFPQIDATHDLESQDQIWPIFMGLALVTKYVDNSVTYSGVSLKQEGKNIADRILSYIKNHNWKIKNPVTGIFIPASEGGEVRQFAYGASEAACFIENGNVSLNPGVPLHSCEDWIHDPIVWGTADLWNDFGIGTVPVPYATFIDPSEDWKILYLAAMGNSWWTDINPIIPSPITVVQSIFSPGNLLHPWNTVTTLVSLVPTPPINVTTLKLGQRALIEHYEHIPLAKQALHGGSNLVSPTAYDILINSAPCEGPWSYGYPSNTALTPSGSPAFEWSTSSRLTKPDERGGNAGAIHNYGEYNGLDYMLYYNLFALSQGTTGSGVTYHNYIDKTITIPFPAGIWGSSGVRASIEAFKSIYANNTINANGDVEYRAGKEVHLGAGFHASAGSEFHAYVDPFECSSDGEYRMTSVNNDSSSDNTMQTAVAYAGAPTFVKHTPGKTETVEEKLETTTSISQSNMVINPEQKTILPAVSPIKESKIRIQPNPNNGSFEVIISTKEIINAKLSILNIFGKSIHEQQITGPITRIDISNEAKGIYYVRIEDASGIKMEKIIYQ